LIALSRSCSVFSADNKSINKGHVLERLLRLKNRFLILLDRRED